MDTKLRLSKESKQYRYRNFHFHAVWSNYVRGNTSIGICRVHGTLWSFSTSEETQPHTVIYTNCEHYCATVYNIKDWANESVSCPNLSWHVA